MVVVVEEGDLTAEGQMLAYVCSSKSLTCVVCLCLRSCSGKYIQINIKTIFTLLRVYTIKQLELQLNAGSISTSMLTLVPTILGNQSNLLQCPLQLVLCPHA